MTSSVTELVSQIAAGSRSGLAKSITLVESTRHDHRLEAEDLLAELLPKTGNAIRIAISGAPGVGKSSFIEALGSHLIKKSLKLAVLAIDPSSPITGGSILGDKTRMEELAKSESCFIRPSPSSGALGGVARHTRETILLCEAAGYDVVLIETVGIGQSEVMAASMTDFFLHLHQPHSGDELQGIKKGVMELADFIIVTKADGGSETAAEIAKADLLRAISLTRTDSDTRPEVMTCSAHKNLRIEEAWRHIENVIGTRKKSGSFAKKRTSQLRDWLAQEIATELEFLLDSHPRYEENLSDALASIEKSGQYCVSAARSLVHSLLAQKA